MAMDLGVVASLVGAAGAAGAAAALKLHELRAKRQTEAAPVTCAYAQEHEQMRDYARDTQRDTQRLVIIMEGLREDQREQSAALHRHLREIAERAPSCPKEKKP